MRGKHGAASAIRREVHAVEQTEAAYRRQIVRLTNERDDARGGRDEARRLWKQEVRALEARLREGTSARVEALTAELERLRAVVDDMKRVHRSRTTQWGRAVERIIAMIQAVNGVTKVEAVETMMSWNLDPASPQFGVRKLGRNNLAEEVKAAEEFEPDLPEGHVDIATTYVDGPLVAKGATEQDAAQAIRTIQRARGYRS